MIWSEKKRWAFLGIPLTFTTYSLTEDKIKQIECMELLYNSFVENNEDIPTWITLEDIARYKIRMLEPEN